MMDPAPRFYTRSGGRILTGSSIPQVLAQLSAWPSFNHDYLIDWLANGFLASIQNLHQTLFDGIYRVPIGYALEPSETGPRSDEAGLARDSAGTRVKRTWSLDTHDDRIATQALPDALREFKCRLTQAVMHSVPGSGRIAVELSGGLDSSAVTAMARSCFPDRDIVALSHGVPACPPHWIFGLSEAEQGRVRSSLNDESRFSRLVARSLRLEHIFITEKFHFHDVIEKHAEILGGFTEVLFPLLNSRGYEIAQAMGIATMLSGFGGDEVASHNATRCLHELRNRNAYPSYVYERIRGTTARQWLERVRLVPRRPPPIQRPAKHVPFLRIDPVRIGSWSPRFTTVKAIEHAFIEGELSIHWQRRIETSQILARHYGIDYQLPLTYPPLMQLVHQLPSTYKRRHGHGRYLMRKSMAGMLPRAVVWRNDKAGATAPAAWCHLIENLPQIFLARIRPDHSGTLAEHVDIPKLVRRMERGPVCDSEVVRLAIAVLMLAHFETRRP